MQGLAFINTVFIIPVMISNSTIWYDLSFENVWQIWPCKGCGMSRLLRHNVQGWLSEDDFLGTARAQQAWQLTELQDFHRILPRLGCQLLFEKNVCSFRHRRPKKGTRSARCGWKRKSVRQVRRKLSQVCRVSSAYRCISHQILLFQSCKNRWILKASKTIQTWGFFVKLDVILTHCPPQNPSLLGSPEALYHRVMPLPCSQCKLKHMPYTILVFELSHVNTGLINHNKPMFSMFSSRG